jgi:hypothetical protein
MKPRLPPARRAWTLPGSVWVIAKLAVAFIANRPMMAAAIATASAKSLQLSDRVFTRAASDA